MKKKKYYLVFFWLGISAIAGLIATLIYDYVSYNSMLNSAPFSLFVLVDLAAFVPVMILFFVLAIVFKKKYKK